METYPLSLSEINQSSVNIIDYLIEAKCTSRPLALVTKERFEQ